MCTVSFFYSQGKVVITSNRDEKTIRELAIPPQHYLLQQKKLFFPKDAKAGGTWFVVDAHSNVGVLLNGAQYKHESFGNYRKSRGLIVLDIMCGISPLAQWKVIELNAIEPFTFVLYEKQQLFQLQWDGMQKSTTELDPTQPHIWSSATLYSNEIRDLRKRWFTNYLSTQEAFEPEDLFHFHRFTEPDNNHHGLVINREENYKTVSITQVVLDKNRVQMEYADLITDTVNHHNFISI